MQSHGDCQNSQYMPKIIVFPVILILWFSCSPAEHFSKSTFCRFQNWTGFNIYSDSCCLVDGCQVCDTQSDSKYQHIWFDHQCAVDRPGYFCHLTLPVVVLVADWAGCVCSLACRKLQSNRLKCLNPAWMLCLCPFLKLAVFISSLFQHSSHFCFSIIICLFEYSFLAICMHQSQHGLQ